MAKKGKKSISRRNQERLRQAMVSFDLASALLMVIVLLAMMWGFGREYDLGKNTFHGFADWFLLIMAYPALVIGSLVNVVTGSRLDFISGREAVVLGSAAAAVVFFSWLTIRIAGKVKNDIQLFKVAANFVRLFFFWGLFQLFCGLAMLISSHGGASDTLHNHLHRPAAPEQVRIVPAVPADTPESGKQQQPKN